MRLLHLFCDVDDFCKLFTHWSHSQLLGRGNKPGPKPKLSASEIMTIIIYFHMTRHRDFKTYYTEYVSQFLQAEFPSLVSYNRFLELMPTVLLPLCLYLQTRLGEVSGISFIDSTPLPVCHNRRIERHKVFAGLAARGKTSMGWFYGFKLHLVVNDQGELLAYHLSAGNVDDRTPVLKLARPLFGKLFGDKGYISQALFEQLMAQNVQLITGLRKNMKNRLLPLVDKLLLRKRVIIETINDQLKNISQIAHTRHRSVPNFLVNVIAGLIAYTHQPKKPALNIGNENLVSLPLSYNFELRLIKFSTSNFRKVRWITSVTVPNLAASSFCVYQDGRKSVSPSASSRINRDNRFITGCRDRSSTRETELRSLSDSTLIISCANVGSC
jgi:hypothetical protein